MNGHISILGLLVLALAGCSDPSPREHGDVRKVFPGEARQVLENADAFVLISLDPVPRAADESTFHGYRELGRVKLDDQPTRSALVNALYAGIAENEESPPACFNPRHGIHATRGGETVDVVICFECLSLKAHSAAGETRALTTRSPEALFNETLKKARVPLSAG